MSNVRFACMGDSITSDQVTGIGTVIQKKLGLQMVGNFACGYATCSDWHMGDRNVTPISLLEPPNTNTADNVLSNQVRRLLQTTTPAGQPIAWTHPLDGMFSSDTQAGVGLGSQEAPDIIYIAISTNDGNHVQNAVADDTDAVFKQSYFQLTRNSIASSLRWAIETLQSAYPLAAIFAASPLQTDGENAWMDYETTKKKRDIIKKVCRGCGVKFIDSFYESGFSRLVAIQNGGVHPNEEWKENIATYVAGQIAASYWLG